MRIRPSGSWVSCNGWWPSFGKKIQTSRFIFEPMPDRAVRHCMPWHDAWGQAMPPGSPKNKRLAAKVQEIEKHVKETDVQKGEKQVAWHSFEYQAQSWAHQERIVVNIERTGCALKTRCLVTTYQDPLRKSIEVFMFNEEMLVNIGSKKSTIGVLLQGCPTMISGRTVVD